MKCIITDSEGNQKEANGGSPLIGTGCIPTGVTSEVVSTVAGKTVVGVGQVTMPTDAHVRAAEMLASINPETKANYTFAEVCKALGDELKANPNLTKPMVDTSSEAAPDVQEADPDAKYDDVEVTPEEVQAYLKSRYSRSVLIAHGWKPKKVSRLNDEEALAIALTFKGIRSFEAWAEDFAN